MLHICAFQGKTQAELVENIQPPLRSTRSSRNDDGCILHNPAIYTGIFQTHPHLPEVVQDCGGKDYLAYQRNYLDR